MRDIEKVSTASVAPPGKHFPLSPKPSDHLRLLHGDNESFDRYVRLRRASKTPNPCSVPVVENQKLSVRELLQWIDELSGEESVYLTQSDYFSDRGARRIGQTTTKFLHGLRTVFVDLDIYGLDQWKTSTTKEVAEAVLAVCRDAGVPAPLVISSGRGLYAQWILDERLNLQKQNAQENWKKVQNCLMGVLKSFNADPRVCDLTRMLRLVGTKNEKKTDELVRVVHDDGCSYSIDHLLACVASLPEFQPERSGRTSGRSDQCLQRGTRRLFDTTVSTNGVTGVAEEALSSLRALLDHDRAVVQTLGGIRSLSYRLFHDIASVVLSRRGVARGWRNEFVFWMLVTRFNAGLFGADELPTMSQFFSGITEGNYDPWVTGELSSLHVRLRQTEALYGRSKNIQFDTRSRAGFSTAPLYAKRVKGSSDLGKKEHYFLARRPNYHPSVTMLLRKLGVSPDEQHTLSILIGAEEKRRRRSLKNIGPKKLKRNAQIAVATGDRGEPAKDVAAKWKLSLSSVYRISSRLKPQPALTKGKRKLQVLKAHGDDPLATVRQLAEMIGVPSSTVHRWIKSDAESDEKA